VSIEVVGRVQLSQWPHGVREVEVDGSCHAERESWEEWEKYLSGVEHKLDMRQCNGQRLTHLANMSFLHSVRLCAKDIIPFTT
jgi:hypothetical protein